MYHHEVSTSNFKTLCSHAPLWLLCRYIYVHIVGTGHYADGFCWFLCVCILSPYLGPYQWLAQSDILHMLTICYWQFDS